MVVISRLREILPVLSLGVFFCLFAGCNISDDTTNEDIDDDAGIVEDIEEDTGDADTGRDADTGPDCPEEEFCSGQCVDLLSDDDHCGQCGNTCDGDLTCDDGQCGCEDDLTACGQSCINTDTDPLHCGDCDNACDSGQCDSGQCVPLECDPQDEPFGGGEGTEDEPYRICSPAQLMRLGDEDYRNLDFALYADLDFELDGSVEFTPIGTVAAPFSGSLDGQHHSISNLSYGQPSSVAVGLFARVTGKVENLTLVGLSFRGADRIGGLAGELRGILSNISVQGEFEVYGDTAGGLIGYNESAGVITDSTADIELLSHLDGKRIGGLVGENYGTVEAGHAQGQITSGDAPEQIGGVVGLLIDGGEVLNSSADITIAIDGQGRDIGGLIGAVYEGGLVSESHATGSVSAPQCNSVGGLVGYTYSHPSESNPVEITNSSADVVTVGLDNVGGLIGQLGAGPGANHEVLNSVAHGTVTGSNRVGGLVGQLVGGSITESGAHAEVNAETHGGGLFGSAAYYSIHRSFATGDVTGQSSLGGLGSSVGYGTINDCYATGTVTGDDSVGGLLNSLNYGSINDSYSIGEVISDGGPAGGLVAQVQSYGTVNNSYWNTTTSGWDTSDGGEGLNNAAFGNESNFEAWDFVDIWTMSASEGRPLLQWQ